MKRVFIDLDGTCAEFRSVQRPEELYEFYGVDYERRILSFVFKEASASFEMKVSIHAEDRLVHRCDTTVGSFKQILENSIERIKEDPDSDVFWNFVSVAQEAEKFGLRVHTVDGTFCFVIANRHRELVKDDCGAMYYHNQLILVTADNEQYRIGTFKFKDVSGVFDVPMKATSEVTFKELATGSEFDEQ